MKKLFFLCTLILFNCAYREKAPVKPSILINTYALDTTKIRFDGFYNTYDTATIKDIRRPDYGKRNTDFYKTMFIKIFNKNKEIIDDREFFKDNTALECDYYKSISKRYKDFNVAPSKFTIKNDSIYSYYGILVTVIGGQRVPISCNFRGFIKNRDTITDWKITKPYPKDFNDDVIKWNPGILEPKTLVFVKTDAVKCLDFK